MSEGLLTPPWLRTDGFEGFVSIGDVRLRRATVSPLPGVYIVYRETLGPIGFLDKSAGGWFKARNPSVPIETLAGAWVDGAHVLYVGKADAGRSGGRGIQKRLDEYLRFGMASPSVIGEVATYGSSKAPTS